MTDKNLTEEEARQFLDLLDKVQDDMDAAFDEWRDATPEEFEEQWGGTPGAVYTSITRRKYRRFVENVYLDGGDE